METQTQLISPSPASSATTTPYTTAPSSPHRHPNFFYSAPTSPIHSLVSFQQHDHNDHDFAFDFTSHPQPPSPSSADQLFHAGKIKPLNPFSDHPPNDQTLITHNPPKQEQEITNMFNNSTRKRSKSSESSTQFTISDILSEEDNNNNNNNRKVFQTWYSKWNLKNLILFRSASEGSTVRRGKEEVRINTKSVEDVKKKKNTKVEGVRKVSAHEMHYTANRAVAEEMRRKTYLPYRSGLFGCLGFHNNGGGGVHQISRGITSVMKHG